MIDPHTPLGQTPCSFYQQQPDDAAIRRSMIRAYRQIERALHAEIALRLKLAPPRCVYFPIPNGVWLPTRSEAERTLARRIVSQMKAVGMLQPGVADWAFLWPGGCGLIEEKRPASQTLFDKIPAGRLSGAQKAFRDWCADVGVEYVVAESWDDVAAALRRWGVAD